MVQEIITRHIKERVANELWARAAGRCQFDGHNELLYKSPITQEKVNIAQRAHIYSFSENGPRGRGPFEKNAEGLNDADNLMLMCHGCHKLIDGDKNGEKYSADLLKKWKQEHEERIAIVTGITPEKKSHVIFYGSNIGKQKSVFQKKEAMEAMFPERYPASENPICLSMSWSGEDKLAGFWETESKNLNSIFDRQINPLLKEDGVNHFSLFSLAPMPLLIQLGALFTDKIPVDAYQPIREPRGWQWQDFPEGFDFLINEPDVFDGEPALAISLSDKIKPERIKKVMGNKVSIWELTVPDEHIGNDSIRAKAQLSLMRTAIRRLMVSIKDKHGTTAPLSVFPAMAVSCSIEMGRARMPKADMPWILYDQNNEAEGFIKTLTIGGVIDD